MISQWIVFQMKSSDWFFFAKNRLNENMPEWLKLDRTVGSILLATSALTEVVQPTARLYWSMSWLRTSKVTKTFLGSLFHKWKCLSGLDIWKTRQQNLSVVPAAMVEANRSHLFLNKQKKENWISGPTWYRINRPANPEGEASRWIGTHPSC